jgi:hypothetical protein
VYLAFDLETQKHVAVKVESPSKKQVLKVEVAILKKLDHPHFPAFIAAGRFIAHTFTYTYLIMNLLGQKYVLAHLVCPSSEKHAPMAASL